MSDKKVMGHNPLGENHLVDAKFDFIPFTERGSGQLKEHMPKMKKSKKVVSYYLEKDLIENVKLKAKEQGLSYSGFVSKVLHNVVDKPGS